MTQQKYLDRVIFIIYQPGTFGSFLRHCINQSIDVYNPIQTTEVFREDGAAHLGIIEYFKKFHDGDYMEQWLALNDIDSYNWLVENYKQNTELEESGKYFTHRSCLPEACAKIKRFFPNSKVINLAFMEDDVSSIASNMANKTIDRWMKKVLVKMPDYYYRLQDMTRDEQIEDYKKICVDQICRRPEIKNVEGVYDFYYKWFLNRDKFYDNYNQLCSFLGIRPGNIEVIYDNFLKANKIQAE